MSRNTTRPWLCSKQNPSFLLLHVYFFLYVFQRLSKIYTWDFFFWSIYSFSPFLIFHLLISIAQSTFDSQALSVFFPTSHTSGLFRSHCHPSLSDPMRAALNYGYSPTACFLPLSMLSLLPILNIDPGIFNDCVFWLQKSKSDKTKHFRQVQNFC